MRYHRFEDLPAWQAAIDLGIRVFAMTATGCLRSHAGLRDQIERAAVSVSNNIAEGFERGTREELLAFLYYAKGSAGEVRSMLNLLRRLPGIATQTPEFDDLQGVALGLSRQLGAWLEALKNSPGKGPRHNNESTRRSVQGVRRQESYLREPRRLVDEGRINPDRSVEPPPQRDS